MPYHAGHAQAPRQLYGGDRPDLSCVHSGCVPYNSGERATRKCSVAWAPQHPLARGRGSGADAGVRRPEVHLARGRAAGLYRPPDRLQTKPTADGLCAAAPGMIRRPGNLMTPATLLPRLGLLLLGLILAHET